MTTYYIKDSLVYSSEPTSLLIPYEFESFYLEELDSQSIIDCLKHYRDKGFKSYTIYGIIPNFQSIKDTIENTKKQSPKEEDYSFLEITSQLLVIKQLKEIISSVMANFPPENVIKLLDDAEQKRKQKKEEIEKELHKIQTHYDKKKAKYDNQITNEIEKKETYNTQLDKDIKEYRDKKEVLEKELSMLSKKQNASKKINELNKDIEKIHFQIQQLEYDIDVFKAKTTTLKNEKKAGYLKKVSPLSFILTLGLIYWSKYSYISHQLSSIQIGIYKNQERISQLKKKQFIKEHKRDSLQEQDKMSVKEQTKKQEELANQIDEYQEKINELEKIYNENGKAIEKSKENLQPLKNTLDEEYNKIISFTQHLEQLQQSIKEEGFEVIKETQQYHQELLNKVKSIEKQIKSQKVSYDKEAICEI